MSHESEILDTFHRFRDALMACDTAALEGLLAEDYCGFNLQGHPEGRTQVLEAYSPGVTSLDVWEISDLRVHAFPDVGILSGVGYVAGAWEGHPWGHHLRFLDVYVKWEGRWQLLLSQSTPMEEPS